MVCLTGEKNRFKTHEKLWELDDKQLKTPKHDAMVLWLMDEHNLELVCKKLFDYTTEKTFIKKDDKNYDFFKIESEVPLLSSPTFIAGYADLIVHKNYFNIIDEYPCPLHKDILDELVLIESTEDMLNLINDFREEPKSKYKKYGSEVYYSLEEGYIDRYGYFRKSCWVEDKEKVQKECYIIPPFATADQRANVKLADFVYNTINVPCKFHEISRWISGRRYVSLQRFHYSLLIEVKPYIDSFGAVLRQINSYKKFKHVDHYCLFTLDKRFDKQFESQDIKVLHPPISYEEMLKDIGGIV